MAKKRHPTVAKTGVERDNDKFIYYAKKGKAGRSRKSRGEVWRAPRRGSKGGKKKLMATWATPAMDYKRFIYFVDGKGNVASAKRKHSGGRRRSRGGR
jgi:hypothetical protein